ncbi:MAG: class I SAM-dependent methyltransferase [Planctomycetota bacterium]|nr:class I SAM-dependent methyltransferase [Planctomycetota bacterium]
MESGSASCPLCGAAAGLACTRDERLFFHCPTCDLVFVPSRLHDSLSEERRRYETHENTLDNAGYVAMFERFIELVSRHCPGVETILDYGSGPGPVLVELLRRRGFRAEGYDPIFAPDTDLSRRFDAVVSTETFEHFARPRREIERIEGLIRGGGFLALMTLFHGEHHFTADWWYTRDSTHVAFYSHRTIRWICEAFRFDLVYLDEKNVAILRASQDDAGG